ncbi:hypothetical protein HYS72_03015 [Candidatus Pacearchaeota archaeon]|nr:hypothetical protein [Candidatus Pacearchaeota archaeon]
MTNLINKNKLNEGMHEFAKDKLNNLEKELDREFKWIIGCINNGGEVERYKNTAMVHISSNYKLKTLGIIREVISPYINYDL